PIAQRFQLAFLLRLMVKLFAKADQHFGNLNLYRAGRLTRATQTRGVRQMMIRSQTVVERSEHGADRPGIDAAVGMPADAAINGARIEACAAANAKQALAQRARENARAPVIENDKMKFLGATEFAG